MVKVLGITDEVTVCGLCGKRDLKCTVCLEVDGVPVHYGRDCAGMTIWEKKTSNHTRKAGEVAQKIAYFRAHPERYTREVLSNRDYCKPEVFVLMFGEEVGG